MLRSDFWVRANFSHPSSNGKHEREGIIDVSIPEAGMEQRVSYASGWMRHENGENTSELRCHKRAFINRHELQRRA